MALSGYAAIEDGVYVFYISGGINSTADCIIPGIQLRSTGSYYQYIYDLTSRASKYVGTSSWFLLNKVYLYPDPPLYSDVPTGASYDPSQYCVVWKAGDANRALTELRTETTNYVIAANEASQQGTTAYAKDYYSNYYEAPSITPLATPTGLYADNITSDSARIGWNAVANATGYKVEYKPHNSNTWIEG